MNENYMALMVAICSPKYVTSEQAFGLLRGKRPPEYKRKQETPEIIKLWNEGWTLEQLQERFNIPKSTIYGRIQRARLFR